jgi:acyl-coenzyme A synthetase/AMP-(fatty) acid ligase
MSSNRYAAVMDSALTRGQVLDLRGPLNGADVNAIDKSLAGGSLAGREAIGICFANGRPAVAAYFALALRGLVAVPLAPTMQEEERTELWRRLGCRYFLDKDGLHPLPGNSVKLEWPEDIHWVMHSSGSTGVPKAIALSFSAVLDNARKSVHLLGCGEDVRHLGSMSQCYTNGLFNSFLLPIVTGGMAVLGPVVTGLSIREFLNLVAATRPEILWVNPTVVKMLLRVDCRDQIKSAKVFVSCTAPLSQSDAVAAEAHLGKPVLQSYGLTETLIASIEKPSRDVQTEYSAGVVLGGKSAIAADDNGRITISNGAVTPGYVNCDGGKLNFELPDGDGGVSFTSSDVGEIDSSGRLSIRGRGDNVINFQGEKIYPGLVEDVLCSLPNVLDAVVAPVSDPATGQRAVAFIRISGTVDLDGLANVCGNRLGPAGRPSRILIVDMLPRTANGKPDRALAAEMAAKVVGGEPPVFAVNSRE